jgi:hypothetical protein
MVPGAEEGSISMVAARRLTSQALTSDLPVRVDAIQEEVQQGPCLDAAYEQHTALVTNMATEDQWPLFAQRASDAGAASMLSLQLFVESDNLGALNLHARTRTRSPTNPNRSVCCSPRTPPSPTPVSGRRPSSARP